VLRPNDVHLDAGRAAVPTCCWTLAFCPKTKLFARVAVRLARLHGVFEHDHFDHFERPHVDGGSAAWTLEADHRSTPMRPTRLTSLESPSSLVITLDFTS
jgi:hypothetical protein